MLIAVAVLATGCKKNLQGVSKGQIDQAWGQISDSDYIRVRGIGAAPQNIVDTTQRRGMARNAALVAARYELLARIKGVKLNGGLSIGDLIQQNGQIKELTDKTIAGAEEVSTEWTKDDGCVVVLQLSRDQVDDVLNETAKYDGN